MELFDNKAMHGTGFISFNGLFHLILVHRYIFIYLAILLETMVQRFLLIHSKCDFHTNRLKYKANGYVHGMRSDDHLSESAFKDVGLLIFYQLQSLSCNHVASLFMKVLRS